ncbi:hypothetical protein [Synechococcus phage S-8S56]|nr:hypothetical protein [Synechococcus phage S-8S56]
MNFDDKLLSSPPKDWKYSKRPFNKKFDAIWLTSTSDWVYTNDPVECIWGFVNVKTNKVHAPINAKKPGDEVSWPTTAYTSMRPPVQRTLQVSILDFC